MDGGDEDAVLGNSFIYVKQYANEHDHPSSFVRSQWRFTTADCLHQVQEIYLQYYIHLIKLLNKLLYFNCYPC